MNRHHGHWMCRSTLAAAIAALSTTAEAALPPPPVSPAPVTDYEYDANGNPTKLIKAKGVAGFGFTSSTSYDALDRVKTSTDARNGVTTLGYDGQDQLKQVQDPRNLVTAYQRNGLGDLTQLTSPDTGTANSTFDANGNLLTRTDSRGVLATYAYDGLNRMTSAVYAKSGQASLSYGWTYDQTGSNFGYGVGRLTTSTSPSGNTKYGYDAQGRLITSIQTVGAAVSTTRYGYDLAGHVTSITYPSGRVLTIAYDNGLPVALSLASTASASPQPLISQIQWEPFGGVRSWLMHMTSGTKLQERVYDAYGRLVRYPLGGNVRDLTYDAADRIVSYTHMDAVTGQVTAAAQAMNQSFGYDEVGRLTGIVTPAASWSMAYDANGNRKDVTLNGSLRTYTTAATSNRLNGVSNPTRTLGYDAAGNTLSDTGLGYTTTYRLDNRVGTLTKGTLTTTYQYDAGGQRVHKEHSAGYRDFVYDQEGQLLGEYNSAGPALEYVWLGDLPVAAIVGTSASAPPMFVYADHLNTPRVLIDKNDAARWRWIGEPFGTTAPEQSPSGLSAVTYNLRFPGQFFDSESGLNYNYFRDYDATTGRYVQSDPIGLGGGINTYAYVGGNPLSGIDPAGLDCRAAGASVSCSVPGGPAITFPRPPGWPDSIKPGDTNYHYYNKWVNAHGVDQKCLQKYLQDHPTPGSPSPATVRGTLNDATPSSLSWLSSSPVKSYSIKTAGGPVVVNVTLPGHPLFPGYVARTVTQSRVGNIVNNFGEGIGWKQGPYSPIANPINSVWYGLTDEAIRACSCDRK